MPEPMTDVDYNLLTFPATDDTAPTGEDQEARAAVRAAYDGELNRVADHLRRGRSALITADKELLSPVHELLREKIGGGAEFRHVNPQPGTGPVPLTLADQLTQSLARLLRDANSATGSR